MCMREIKLGIRIHKNLFGRDVTAYKDQVGLLKLSPCSLFCYRFADRSTCTWPDSRVRPFPG